LTKALADTILPRTNTPSASDVKVPEFIDLLLNDVFEDAAKKHLLDGLTQFDGDFQKATGKSLHRVSPRSSIIT
jgi:hypothetical protein